MAAAKTAAPRVLLLEGLIGSEEAGGLPGVIRAESLERQPGTPPRVAAMLAPDASVQDTLRAVFAQGLDVIRFEMKEPSLHDAFIVLTGGTPAPADDRAAT